MDITPNFLICYLTLIGATCIVILAGHLLSSIFKLPEEKNYCFFIKLIVGLVGVSTLYALITTKGNTSLICLLPILICYLCFEKGKVNAIKNHNVIQQIKDFEWKYFFLFIAVLTGCYFLQIFKFIDWHGNQYAVWSDPLFYANGAANFNRTGKEVLTSSLLYPHLLNPTYGHFFESWFTALFGKLFSMSYGYIMMLIYFPLTLAIAYWGGTILTFKISNKRIKTVWIYILSALIIFIAPWRTLLTFANLLIPVGYISKYNLLYDTVQKFSIIYILIILFFIINQSGFKRKSLYVMLALGIIYPITLPAIFVSTILFEALYYIKHRNKEDKYILLSTLLTMCSFIAFYLLNSIMATGKLESGQDEVSLLALWIEQAGKITYYKSFISNIALTLVRFIIASIPYIVILFIIPHKYNFIKKSKELQYISLTVFIAFLGYNAIYFIWDADQFFSNIIYPFINIGSFTIIILGIVYNKKLLIYGFCLLFFNILMTVSNSDFKESCYRLDINEYTELCEDMKQEKNIRAIYLWDGSYYYKNPKFILTRTFPDIISEQINVQDYDPISSTMDAWNFNSRRKNLSIFQFAIEKGYANPNSWECRLAFIKEAKVNYLFMSESYDEEEVERELPIEKKYYLPIQQGYVYKIRNKDISSSVN